jgi:glutamate 5-kinase
LRLDAGAVAALKKGGSLLPVGVVDVRGSFSRGDAVGLMTADEVEIGRGLAAYDAEEMRKILGCRSEDIEARLGYRGRSVVVHRDDLVIFKQ